MNILILGGSGFIGTNLIQYISKKSPSANITSTSSRTTKNHIKLDILDAQKVSKIVKNQDIIINLAGLSGAVESGKNPQKTIETNTIGHLNILQACRENNSKALIIFASSRLEYGPLAKLPINEHSELSPETIYGISKYTATKYSLLYNSLYNLKTIVLRMSNPFGPQKKQTHAHYNIVNHFILSASQNKELVIYGKGMQQRDYIYIEDVLEAFWNAMHSKQAIGKVLNIGLGKPYRVLDIAKTIVNKMGKGKIVFKSWPDEWKKIETGDFYFDIREAKKILNWNPNTSVEDGIELTINK